MILILIWGYTIVYGQNLKPDVISTAGSFYANSTYSVSWTIGECETEAFSATGNTLQGFQQSLYVVTSINELTIQGTSVKAYPNHVSDLINISIEIENGLQNPILVELFDSQGKILMSDKFSTDLIQHDMAQYSGGFYLLKVANQNNKQQII